MAKNDPVSIEDRWKQEKIPRTLKGHDARFGQDRLKNVTKEDFLDGLLAQGVPMDFLKQFAGDSLPNITSILIKSGFSRSVMERAYNIAKAYQGEGETGGNLSKLSPESLLMYHIDLRSDPMDTAFANKFYGELRKKGKNVSLESIMDAARKAGMHPGVLENARHAATNIRYDKYGDKKQINEPQHQTHRPFAAQQVQPGALSPPMNERLIGARGQGFEREDPAEQAAAQNLPLQTLPTGVGTGADAGAGGGGAPPPYVDPEPPPRTPEEKLAYIKKWYGSQAWYLDIPEVRDMLFEAAAKEMPASEVVERLKGTGWWQRTDGKQRAWYAYEREDPESAKVDISKQQGVVEKLARDAGIELTPERARDIASSYLRNGWGLSELNQALAAEFYYDPEDRKGGATVEGLKTVARDYMVPISDDAIRTWGRDLISGAATEDNYKEFLKEQAKSLFPQLSSALDRGETVSKYMSGFYEMARQTLGIDPTAIDFTDQKWTRPLYQTDEKGERTVMSLDQWQTVLRTDERYGYTKTQRARNEATELASSLIKTFKGV